MQDPNTILALLHDKLLALHKILVDVEKDSYERNHGQVKSVDFLNLLIHDPEYSWLRKISELIVWIDEILDPKVLTAEVETKNVLEQTRKLLNPSELGDDFERKYQDALQKNPDVILAHQQVREVLKGAS